MCTTTHTHIRICNYARYLPLTKSTLFATYALHIDTVSDKVNRLLKELLHRLKLIPVSGLKWFMHVGVPSYVHIYVVHVCV